MVWYTMKLVLLDGKADGWVREEVRFEGGSFEICDVGDGVMESLRWAGCVFWH